MNLVNLKAIFERKGSRRVYVKKLSENDNSKNQVYFGGNFDVLNIFPISEIRTEEVGKWEKQRFKASLDFSWIGEDGNAYPAPNAQLILYPKYPEVRFSGFLAKCENPPSELMTQRIPERLLFLSVTNDRKILGYVASPLSELASEFNAMNVENIQGVFHIMDLPQYANSREKLIQELLRIHNSGWIKSKRLVKEGLFDCESPNCGGYTLEAELGITTNANAEPDYLGWEVKQFSVSKFSKLSSRVITLFTPEPNAGFYRSAGVAEFLFKYGYKDRRGRENRINFGGIHKVGIIHRNTSLELKLIGYDHENKKIRNVEGRIALVDPDGNEAASWDFSSLLKHWNRKHSQACYVPSRTKIIEGRYYSYGNQVILGYGTDFNLFLDQFSNGNIYYDPGIKIENIHIAPKIKTRSQFRIYSQNIKNLYREFEIVDLTLQIGETT